MLQGGIKLLAETGACRHLSETCITAGVMVFFVARCQDSPWFTAHDFLSQGISECSPCWLCVWLVCAVSISPLQIPGVHYLHIEQFNICWSFKADVGQNLVPFGLTSQNSFSNSTMYISSGMFTFICHLSSVVMSGVDHNLMLETLHTPCLLTWSTLHVRTCHRDFS